MFTKGKKEIRHRLAGVDAPSISRHSGGEVTSDLEKLRFRFKVKRTSERASIGRASTGRWCKSSHVRLFLLHVFVVIGANDGMLAISQRRHR